MSAMTPVCRPAVVATLGKMKCSAKHGRIMLVDQTTGDITYLLPVQFSHRVHALRDHYNKAVARAEGGYEFLLDGLSGRHWRKFFEDFDAVCLEVASQVPIDAFAERRARRPKQVSMMNNLDR